MGNLFSLEIISFDIFISPFGNNNDFWAKSSFFLILFVLFALFVFFFIKRCFPKGSSKTKNNWVPPPSIFTHTIALICIISFIFPLIDSAPIKPIKPKIPKKLPKNVLKGFAKSTSSLLSYTALYFGLDYLANFFQEEPELSLFIVISVSTIIFLLASSVLAKLFTYFCRSRTPNSNNSSSTTPSNSHELNNFPCPNKRA